MRNVFLTYFVFQFCSLAFLAQDNDVWFHPNKGQWEEEILYKVELDKGAMFIEKDGFTFFLHDANELYGHAHAEGEEHHHHDHDHDHEFVQCHAIFSKFKNSSWKGKVTEKDTSYFYRNYFLSDDSSRWASDVYAFQQLTLHDYYPNIDLVLETTPNSVKYSFVVFPDGDVSQIQLEHNGADRVELDTDNNQISLHTRFGSIEERGLIAWQEDNNERLNYVSVDFNVINNTVSFYLPNGYDNSKTLVIDPELTFSTFSGSTADNWGFTAAPDPQSNTFGGGIVFATGYPTTPGAYDVTFNGGEGQFNLDIGITKFNQFGNALIYSTYIGGSRNEAPTSLVSNAAGELYILGVTSSMNFPLAGSPVQNTFAGGPTTTQNSLTFSGTDLIILKLSTGGNQLLGSTYYGGSGLDGINLGSLHYNYGDQFRGEITVDESSNVYIASSTRSNNFPTPNGFNSTLGGTQDAVAIKMSPDLSTVFWSTYIGGNSFETGNALQLSSDGNVYVTGGTNSTNIGVAVGHTSNIIGGLSDGYVIQLNGNTSQPISGTYVGTTGYDQCFFVQLDLEDNVYVFGQTNGNMPISGGVYSNPNSGQFIRKYNTNLTQIEWTTRVGGGSGHVEISPTAFLVSDCYEIYYAGWGGVTNQGDQATNSTTTGFPTTPNAFQSNTNGNNFYVAVLGENASALNYASFMGGISGSANHVDGGTSRFDKKGRIYHAVCASCGSGTTGFTSTPGAYATQSGSSNCNMAVFKFDLGIIEALATTTTPLICIPEEAVFQNGSENANMFFWDFGDGNTSTEFEPTHAYEEPGVYTVKLVASDSLSCYESDSSFVTISVGSFEGGIIEPIPSICPGESVTLEAYGGMTYAWSPGQYMDDSTSATPTVTIFETTTFEVVITDSCGVQTETITVPVFGGSFEIIEDQQMCIEDTLVLWAQGGQDYQWQPSNLVIGNANSSEIQVSPPSTTEFTVNIVTEEGCELRDTVLVEVFTDLPIPVIDDSLEVCMGDAVQISVSGGDAYSWSPTTFIDNPNASTVSASPITDTWYFVEFINACGSVFDSVLVKVIEVFPSAGNDTIVCPGEPVSLWAEGGTSYLWSPEQHVADPTSPQTTASPDVPTNYVVTVFNDLGCFATDTVFIEHFPTPYIQTSPDYYGFQGDEVTIHAEGNSQGTYTWSPSEYLNCVNCQTVVASPPITFAYRVDFVDENGCTASDSVRIFFDPIIYVPNTFTPNGDGENDYFFPVGGNIREFTMLIFNRWGELIYEFDSFEDQWDGTYFGNPVQDGTYVWKIKYTDLYGNREVLVGHVNLLR